MLPCLNLVTLPFVKYIGLYCWEGEGGGTSLNCSNQAPIGEIGSTPPRLVNDLQLVKVDRILVENFVLGVLLQVGSEVLNNFDGLLRGERVVMRSKLQGILLGRGRQKAWPACTLASH